MADISRDEFHAWMEDIKAGIHGIHSRLDALNGRTRSAEQDIAVLRDRSNISKGSAAAWGGGISGLVVGLVEIVKWFTGK